MHCAAGSTCDIGRTRECGGNRYAEMRQFTGMVEQSIPPLVKSQRRMDLEMHLRILILKKIKFANRILTYIYGTLERCFVPFYIKI